MADEAHYQNRHCDELSDHGAKEGNSAVPTDLDQSRETG
jgi:hypothetical protein